MHSSHDHPTPSPDPEALLRTGLRETTPEFEARFDALRRRLATEPASERGASAWAWWFAQWRGAVVGAAGLAAAAMIAVLVLHEPGQGVVPGPVATADLEELFTLDAVLRGGVVLTDETTREAVRLMPVESGKGNS